jgi:tRNA threonylcarbamoyl adenosine modification protein (Sua5/YciO/YrdC/YwlC family)
MIARAVSTLQRGGVIAYPTDSGYSLGCCLEARAGVDEIRKIRNLSKQHNFTLICRDLSELSAYAMVDNAVYRYMKERVPGPYTFILRASKQVPKRLLHPKRKSLGLRVSKNSVVKALLTELDEPLMSVSLQLDELDEYVADIDAIDSVLLPFAGIFLDAGDIRIAPSQVIDCTEGSFTILRD